MPLLPALAASSPFAEGRPAPMLDMRIEAYRHNCDRVPSITARLVPEWVASRAAYEARILEPIYRDLLPLDPEGVLRGEWVNARGAIARFSRSAIEIRILDIQECPRADLAILQFIVEILKRLVDQTLAPYAEQKAPRTRDLERHLLSAAHSAGQSIIDDRSYLRALGVERGGRIRSGEVLRILLDRAAPANAPWREDIEFILRRGCLARRIRKAAGRAPDNARLRDIYMRLAGCLRDGVLFET
jgi:gamma-glutamyl:cysteine ligase YbdK (ATP-grasp superfamily)